MKRYEKYKPSGVEWIGGIPERWRLKRLKFNTYIKARVGWHGLRADEFSLTDGVFCVTGTDFQNRGVNWENCYRVSEERYEEDPYIQLKENDLLITKDGTIGKVAIVGNLNERATLNSGVFVVRPKRQEYVTSFMYWALQSPVFSEYVNYTSKGSTINHLYQETFFDLPFVLPAIDEQTVIANYLDEKTTQIDTLIANKQKLIELLKEERTAIINHAVTKGLNPKVKLKPSGIEWLGDIPEHWEVKKLKYVAEVQSSNVDKKSYEDEISILLCNYIDVYKNEFIDDSILFMEATAKENEIEKFLLQEGDVLITKDSETPDDIANPAYVTKDFKNVICGYHLAQIKSNKTELTGVFLFRLFQSREFNSHFEVSANGVTRFGLPLASITDVFVPLPPIEEQTAIVQHIETQTQRINATISKIEKEIELLQEYRTALISEVVTGKIKVA